MSWYPHVIVATIVEKDSRFLLVEENCDGKLVINQPAGHLEQNESLPAAALRETMEETAWEVELTGIVGVNRYLAANGITYIRTTFAAKPMKHFPDKPLDNGILRALWLTLDEIRAHSDRLRSPMVILDIENYLHKPLFPMELYSDHG